MRYKKRFFSAKMVKIYKRYIRTFSLFPLISTKTVLQGSIEDPFPITVLSTISASNESSSGYYIAQHSLTHVYAWNGCDRSVIQVRLAKHLYRRENIVEL